MGWMPFGALPPDAAQLSKRLSKNNFLSFYTCHSEHSEESPPLLRKFFAALRMTNTEVILDRRQVTTQPQLRIDFPTGQRRQQRKHRRRQLPTPTKSRRTCARQNANANNPVFTCVMAL
jgi:hypothetical protein